MTLVTLHIIPPPPIPPHHRSQITRNPTLAPSTRTARVAPPFLSAQQETFEIAWGLPPTPEHSSPDLHTTKPIHSSLRQKASMPSPHAARQSCRRRRGYFGRLGLMRWSMGLVLGSLLWQYAPSLRPLSEIVPIISYVCTSVPVHRILMAFKKFSEYLNKL